MRHSATTWVPLVLALAHAGCGGSTPNTTQAVEAAERPAAPAPEPAPEAAPTPAPYVLVAPEQQRLATPEAAVDARPWPNAAQPVVARSRALRPISSVRSLQQLARTASELEYGLSSYGGSPSVSSMSSHLQPSARSSETSDAAPSPSPGAASPAGGAESITSQQVAGIDEGDIVKRLQDHMIVLRQGVLYAIGTVGALAVVDRITVQRPGEAEGWLDEVIVHQGTRRVVVTGFVEDEQEMASTVYKLFTLGQDGHFVRGEAIYLRSSDYYSEDNYATRLMGDNLVTYSVHALNLEPMPTPEELARLSPEEAAEAREAARWDNGLPAMRVGETGAFRSIWSARRLHRLTGSAGTLMHAITTCDLTSAPLACSSRGVMASEEAELFVSHTASYLFLPYSPFAEPPSEDASDEVLERFEETSQAHPLYRLPHSGAAPQVVPMLGSPADGALSFLETSDALHVLLDVSELAYGAGQANPPSIALARVPLRDFGRRIPRHDDFRALPGDSVSAARFVGGTLLYGTIGGRQPLFAHELTSGTTRVLYDGLEVGRIDPLGADGALVSVDERDALHYLTLDLRTTPRVSEHRRIPSTSTSETRTHGFFYRPDADGGSFGMPLTVEEGTARSLVAFFDVRDFRTQLIGELSSQPVSPQQCHHSCFDWYGNSRPIFWDARVFALLGPEVVEGVRVGNRIVDNGRVLMTPPEVPQ